MLSVVKSSSAGENQSVNPQMPQVNNAPGKIIPEDLAYLEVGPNDKKGPRKVPVFKIILSLVLVFILFAIILSAYLLSKKPEKLVGKVAPAAEKVQAILSPYPAPESNTCGYEAKICASGNVAVKKGINCDFTTCPDTSQDMTKFWKIQFSDRQNRTYKNLDLKYDFTIPSNWDFIGKDSGFIFYSPNFSCKTTNDCIGSAIELTSSQTTGKSDIEDWYKSDENYIAKNSNKTQAQINNYKVAQIAGLKAIEMSDRTNAKTFYFVQDNTVFILSLKSSTYNDYINGSKAFEKITSSFKFN